ncbi:MAG: hypothetical protein MJB57_15400 [Gemmatimonadetes bacterium]|nr:hypothetical protein [Gemmatimonadota bacterium]
MSHRKFSDRTGQRWEVRVTSKAEWRFEPIMGNPGPPRRGAPPLYAGDDPFEMSEMELQQTLADATPAPAAPGGPLLGRDGTAAERKTPFGDVYESPKSESPFGDGGEAPKKKSPFLDDQ